MADVQSSRHAAAFLMQRINGLPHDVLTLLSAGAVLGKEFDLALATVLAGMTSAQAIAALDEARRRHIVWAGMQDTHCSFIHDKLRQTLLGRLEANECAELHRRAAVQLEQGWRVAGDGWRVTGGGWREAAADMNAMAGDSGALSSPATRHAPPATLFEIAYHFDAAGQSDRALPYALVAAQKARAQHSLEIAEQQYRIAQRGVSTTDAATRAVIAEGLGDVFMLRGRYEQAAEQFKLAFQLARGNVAQAKIECKLGELAFKRGEIGEARERIERALVMLGRIVPRWSITFLVMVLWEVLVQVLHTLLPKLFVGRRKTGGGWRVAGGASRKGGASFACASGLCKCTSLKRKRRIRAKLRLILSRPWSLVSFFSPPATRHSPPDFEFLAIRLYSRLAHLYWFHRGTIPSLWAHLRELNLAERYPPTPELAQAYSEEAPGMSLIPYFSRGIAYVEKSLAIRKQLGDLWGQGQSLHYYGIILYASSRFKECIKKCREAIRLLERTGDYWEMNIARYQIAASLYRLGDLGGAVAEAQRMYQSGVDLGDAQACGISLDVWSWASLGRLDADVIQGELVRRSSDVQRTAQVLEARGVKLLHQGCAAEAVQVFADAQARVHKAGVRNAWVAPLLPWLTTALRQQIQNNADLTPFQRRGLLRQALATARRGLRLARSFRNDLPRVLRELGYLQAMAGRPRRARRCFHESLCEAQRQGAVYEHAQTMLARGQVGRELGWPQAQDDLAAAKQILPTLEAAVGGAQVASRNAKTATGSEPSLSLADRFDNVLEAGRRIASALSRDAIFAAVREAAMTLLRGERCLVLEEGAGDGWRVAGEGPAPATHHPPPATPAGDGGRVTGEGPAPATHHPPPATPFSQSMVQRALTVGRTIAFVEGVSENSSESVVLSGVRSALCAPIFVRGRAMGCFYVTHRQVAGLFAEEEERLADFIATLAGAALENAAGFDELHRLNQTLEHKIEESQQAEKRIQEQAALLDKARDAISVQDLDDRLLFWNQSAQALYGWSAAEVLGKKACDLLYRDAAQLRTAFQTVLQRGEWSGELRQTTRAGKEIIVESRWSLVRDDDGAPKAKLVVSTDVTEKKKVEAQLMRAQRMESIGTLAGGIAHDINNVLTPILMGVDLLRINLPEDQRLSILASLKTSASRGAEMVKQILSFARGVEGQRVLLQFKHVVADVEKMLRHTLPKSIEIDTDFARGLPAILGDATQLYQMLMNLCVNARDAMPNGGRLTIRLEQKDVGERTEGGRDLSAFCPPPSALSPPLSHVLLTVEDTGSGIAPDVLDKIFDPFFTTKEYGKGTGLGLSTVLGIVKGHGGFINVASTPGLGTKFYVYLPAAETTPAIAPDTEPPAAPTGAGELILVVDDEPSIREVTQTNLQANGYQVLTAANGAEALALCTQHQDRIKLSLTDMMMPGMDGVAVTKALQKLNPNIKIIGLSGLASNRDSAEAAGIHFQRFLLKPFAAAELLQAVGDVLKKEQHP